MKKAKLLSAVLMALIMSATMSLIMGLFKNGFSPAFLAAWLEGWALTFLPSIPLSYFLPPVLDRKTMSFFTRNNKNQH